MPNERDNSQLGRVLISIRSNVEQRDTKQA